MLTLSYRLHHEEILPCLIKNTRKCEGVEPDNVYIKIMENLLQFATDECKVNYLDKEKTLNIFKIVLPGVQFPED
jgi:hypothetical protein